MAVIAVVARSLDHCRHCSGIGKIKNRDNAALYGTDSEHKLRNADDPFYKKFAAECSRVQIAVDVFVLGCATAGSPALRTIFLAHPLGCGARCHTALRLLDHICR